MNSKRRLPHVYTKDRWLFVTWHLYGSLPKSHFPPPDKASAGRAFVWIDRQLDMAPSGPMYLKQDLIAKLVIDSLHRGVELGHYELGAFAVMANHVHVLLLPKIEPPQLLKSIKGFTARQANLILGRTGEPFWQRESYDHCVRDDHELGRITAYIEGNPVKAGLVALAEEYRWSSAWEREHSQATSASMSLARRAPLPGPRSRSA